MISFKDSATANLDALPPDFSLERLRALLEPQEIEALRGDDAMPGAELFPDEQPKPAPAAVQPQSPAAQMMQAQPAPVMPVLPDVPDTTAAKTTVDAFDSKIDALQRQFDDGELDTSELRNAMKALALEQANAQALIQQAANVEKIRTDTQTAVQATVEQQWKQSLDAYKAQNPALWETEHIDGWDAALRAVTGGPWGETLTMAQCIEKAHEVYRMNYTATTGKVLGAPAPGQKTQMNVSDEPRDPPPQTLAGVNGELSADAFSSKFAAIEAAGEKDPIYGEFLLRQLSEAEREAWQKQYS